MTSINHFRRDFVFPIGSSLELSFTVNDYGTTTGANNPSIVINLLDLLGNSVLSKSLSGDSNGLVSTSLALGASALEKGKTYVLSIVAFSGDKRTQLVLAGKADYIGVDQSNELTFNVV